MSSFVSQNLLVVSVVPKTLGTVQSGAQHNATVTASFQPMQLSFSRPRCVSSKCTCTHLCAHMHVGLKMGCGQAHC